MPKKPVTTEAYSLAEAQAIATNVANRGGRAVIENSLKPGLYVVRSDRPGYPLELHRTVSDVRAHPREGTRGVRAHYRRTVSRGDMKELASTIADIEEEFDENMRHTDTWSVDKAEVDEERRARTKQLRALRRIKDFVESWG